MLAYNGYVWYRIKCTLLTIEKRWLSQYLITYNNYDACQHNNMDQFITSGLVGHPKSLNTERTVAVDFKTERTINELSNQSQIWEIYKLISVSTK